LGLKSAASIADTLKWSVACAD